MLEELYLPFRIRCREKDNLPKILSGDVLRTTKSKKMTSWRQIAECLNIDLLVSLHSSGDVLSPSHKWWRIKNDKIEGLRRLADVGKHVFLQKSSLLFLQMVEVPIFPGKALRGI